MKRFCHDGVLERWKVRLALRRARRMGFREDELDDVMQELALTLAGVEYDAANENGAKEETVLTSVIDRQLCKMRRTSSRRDDLEQQIAISADETYNDENGTPRSDVETVVGMLDDQQRHVCDLLSQGYSKSAIAKELGCGWHTVDRIVRDIRGQFQQHGFGEK